MNNPKLQGIVNRFATDKKVSGEFWEKYQFFSNYILLKKVYHSINEDYPYESLLDISLLEGINFGKESTMAVDGCFLLHGKEILYIDMDSDELETKLSLCSSGTLHIVLIQTKSGKLETTDLDTLASCLSTNFSSQPEWKKFIDLKSKCERLLHDNALVELKFHCYYVEGKATDPSTFKNNTFKVREDSLKKAMKEFFWIRKNDSIVLDYYNDETLLNVWEEQEVNTTIVNKTINYLRITSEIEIVNVGKIVFGAIEFGELMKIIYDKEKSRRNELYGYNVRDEVKNNNIKNDIIRTIKSKGNHFILLNNGVTLIVDKHEPDYKNRIKLQNIRIVNGCQTCNAILEVCKNTNQYDKLQVSVKIIETENDEILLGDITYSTNYQNPVTKENLISIHPKMFELEKTFKDFDIANDTALETCLFERREGQFKGTNFKFIDMLALAKAYISLWEKYPHEALMYKDEVLDKFIKQRESDQDFIKKSLLAGILWHNIYKNIPSILDNARYHIYSVLANYSIENKIFDLNNKYSIQNFVNSLHIEVNIIINIIKNCTNDAGEYMFPASTKRGKIHYRKFYPPSALSHIQNKYEELKNK